jgi:hypothetical protein
MPNAKCQTPNAKDHVWRLAKEGEGEGARILNSFKYYLVIHCNLNGFISSFLSNDEIGRLCIRLVHSPKYKNNYIQLKGTSLLQMCVCVCVCVCVCLCVCVIG